MADEEGFLNRDDDIIMVDSDDDVEDLEDEDDDEVGEVGEDNMHDEDDETSSAAVNPPSEEDNVVARRRAIQEIMRDNSLSDQGKRMRIQSLMSGGRTAVAPAPTPIIPNQEEIKCNHYERNCNIIAPCCGRIVGCRICHDETSPPGHPPMNRFMIREVVCKHCSTRQMAS
ncbi:unnamed protein product [Pseudo-nitzschia multistriata]|uniref:CHY-type domain-containing protein n=1 Tax=Pseudo-nitzschia multistriata TaxID=183589 RepID=A0A448ZP28_9STRA|nr:unnamed protein product [Pseudo-nitzschia multistriata]